jgi:hypothetical protein
MIIFRWLGRLLVQLSLHLYGDWELCGECKRFSPPSIPYCPYCPPTNPEHRHRGWR